MDFTCRLIELRKKHPNLRRRKFFQDRPIDPAHKHDRDIGGGKRVKDIAWYRPDGEEMAPEEWTAGWVRCLGLLLSGKTLEQVNQFGQPLTDDTYLLILNPHHEVIQFYMPKTDDIEKWEVIIDTRTPEPLISTRIQSGKLST